MTSETEWCRCLSIGAGVAMQSPTQSILSLYLLLRPWLKILSNLPIRAGSVDPMDGRGGSGVVDDETSLEDLCLSLLVFGGSFHLLSIWSGGRFLLESVLGLSEGGCRSPLESSGASSSHFVVYEISSHLHFFVVGGWGAVAMRSIPIVLMLPSAMVLEVLRVCVYAKFLGGICAISSMLWEEEEVGEASFSGHSVLAKLG